MANKNSSNRRKTGTRKEKPGVDQEISPIQALRFLEDMRKLGSQIYEPTQLISIRVPVNLLRILKTRAKLENKKYQSMIIDLIRKGLQSAEE